MFVYEYTVQYTRTYTSTSSLTEKELIFVVNIEISTALSGMIFTNYFQASLLITTK
jgi:hypothetical protein